MSSRLAGKTAIITGAASGQGRAAAVMFAREGARLAICDVNEQGLRRTAELLEPRTECYSTVTDVGAPGSVAAFVSQVVKRFAVIDIIYNNAGVLSSSPLGDLSPEEWDLVFDVNVKGSFLMVKFALPALARSKAGCVINVSSGSALIGHAGGSAYCSSKAAVIALTRAMACDLAPHNVRVNCILPGPIDTPMPRSRLARLPPEQRGPRLESIKAGTIARRLGESEEVAAVALFLCTEDASYINGAVIPVDGGLTALAGGRS